MNIQVKPLDDLHTFAILWGSFELTRKYPEEKKRVQHDYRQNYLTKEEHKTVQTHISQLCPNILTGQTGKTVYFGYHTLLYSPHAWRVFDWAAAHSLNFFPFTATCLTKMGI